MREADDGVERRAQLVAHVGEEFRLGAVGGLGPRFLFVIAFGEIGELLGLLFERAARLSELCNGGQKQPLGVDELLLMFFQRSDVGADRDIAAVASAALVDLQPAPIVETRLVGARMAEKGAVASGAQASWAITGHRHGAGRSWRGPGVAAPPARSRRL